VTFVVLEMFDFRAKGAVWVIFCSYVVKPIRFGGNITGICNNGYIVREYKPGCTHLDRDCLEDKCYRRRAAYSPIAKVGLYR